MKLRLSVNQKPLNGYLNIDPINSELNGVKNFVSDIRAVDDYVGENECTEIILDKCLEYIPFQKLQEFLTLIVSKMRHKSKLVIYSYEAQEVARCYLTNRINTLEYNQVLYGTLEHPWDCKTCNVSMNEISDLLQSLSLRVLMKDLDGINFTLTATRI